MNRSIIIASLLACFAILIFSGQSSAYVRKTKAVDNGQAFSVNESGQIVGEYYNNGAYDAYVWQNGNFTDIGAPLGNDTLAHDINAGGTIVGHNCISVYPSIYQGIIWEDGAATVLGTLGGDGSIAYYINNAGQVIGVSNLAPGDNHPFIWENGVMTDLGSLGGSSAMPNCINEAGQVVGYGWISYDQRHQAFIWNEGTLTNLRSLNRDYSEAYSINEAGQVVGWSTYGPIFPPVKIAFIINPLDTDSDGKPDTWFQDDNGDYINELMIGLGTLGGASSIARDISDTGQVVGNSTTASGDTHGFIWQDGVMTDLGTLGGTGSEVYRINNSGQVIGWSQTAAGDWHAFVWENGTMTDLGTFGGAESRAFSITDNGKITGWANSVGGSASVLWEVLHGQPVGIDVIPGDDTNSINLGRAKTVPVAILSTATFDATQLDPSTVEMESANVYQKHNGTYSYSIVDVNQDSLMDMVCDIDASQLILPPGISNVAVYGVTTGGTAVEGSSFLNNTE